MNYEQPITNNQKKMNNLAKKTLANILRSYCKNTPIEKGKYRIHLLAQRYLKIQETIPYEYFNVKYHLDLNSTVGSRLFYFGDYESDDIKKCLQFLKKDAVFLDIGANIGFYSLSAAKHGAKVYAIEPNAQAYSQLKNNIQLNPDLNIQAFNFACADRDGEVSFTVAVDAAYSSMHDTAYDWQDWKIQKSEQVTVPAKKVDTLIDELAIDTIDYCKIDVEGGELSVLKGAVNTLSQNKIKALQIEIDSATYHGAGYQPQDLVEFLKSFGYQTDVQSLAQINTPGSYGNFLFFPE
jgi:FkbM family methyltransferase